MVIKNIEYPHINLKQLDYQPVVSSKSFWKVLGTKEVASGTVFILPRPRPPLARPPLSRPPNYINKHYCYHDMFIGDYCE